MSKKFIVVQLEIKKISENVQTTKLSVVYSSAMHFE